MALSMCLRNALVSFWLLWVVTFVVTRVYALHEAYVFEVGKRNDERWLLRQCQDAEFYSNLKQHSDLCTEVCMMTLFFYSLFEFKDMPRAHTVTTNAGPLHRGAYDRPFVYVFYSSSRYASCTQ